MSEKKITAEKKTTSALGFDFGTKKIGTAIGQTLTQTATPLKLINRPDGKMPWEEITDLIKEWQPHILLVGLPLHADGSDNDWAQRCRRFSNQLNGRYSLPIALVDERHSSQQAEVLLAKTGGKTALDNVAACLIVERWLQS